MYSILSIIILCRLSLAQDAFECDENTPGSTLTLTNLKEIKCESDGCCQGTTITATCANGESCKVECVAEDACNGLTLNINSVESFICDKVNACNGAQIIITDPADDFAVDCKDENSCEELALTAIITSGFVVEEDENIEINGILCDKENACLNAAIGIINDNAADTKIESFGCPEVTSCTGLTLDLASGSGGNVIIDKCECADALCSGVTGADACLVGLEKLECKNMDCANQVITITNPLNDFELICSDTASCLGSTITIIVNDDAIALNDGEPVDFFKGIKCGGDMSCDGLTVIVQNDQTSSGGGVIRIEKIECDGDDSCPNASFGSDNVDGSFIVEEVVCGGDNACPSGGSIICVAETAQGLQNCNDVN